MGRRSDVTALLHRLKKRLNEARKALKVGDDGRALEEVDYAIIELEAEVEEEAGAIK